MLEVSRWIKNTCQNSIGKKSVDSDYSALAEEIETNPKAPKFKVSDSVRTTKKKKYFWQRLHWNLVKRYIYDWFCIKH